MCGNIDRYFVIEAATLLLMTITVTLVRGSQATVKGQPHIIVILGDDMGWNDVGFHGSDQIPTPNLDALAYNGVILNNNYVLPLCTPSRSALMTGLYPIRTGMQHNVLLTAEPRGLPLDHPLLPQYLKNLGYATHIVGKWHLGFYKKEYTPTCRGFDSHYGYWTDFDEYYSHIIEVGNMSGFNIKYNLLTDWSSAGQYTTDLLTDKAIEIIKDHNNSTPLFLILSHAVAHVGNSEKPLQAPDRLVEAMSHISDPNRRLYAAMVASLDESTGKVMTALNASGILDNSLIIFSSDNGGATVGYTMNHASNWPLRGVKNGLWEGGIKAASFIWSPLLKSAPFVSNHLMHITDWLPTLVNAAGGDASQLEGLDGIDMWSSLINNTPSPRETILLNIDPLDNNYSALRNRDWKIITGGTVGDDYWYGSVNKTDTIPYNWTSVWTSEAGQIVGRPSINAASTRSNATVVCNVTENTLIPCEPSIAPCLFNILEDPCEYQNLASEYPDKVLSYLELIGGYANNSIPPGNVPIDPAADPEFYNGTWYYWKDQSLKMISSLRRQ